jgi:hypothetical protein
MGHRQKQTGKRNQSKALFAQYAENLFRLGFKVPIPYRKQTDGVIDNAAAFTQNQASYALLFFYRHVLKKEPSDINQIR